MSDEGFHEIQLNGKQLVFLFMAATVVAVVIFLCGVMVGRGVPTRAALAVDAPHHASLDPTAAIHEPSPAEAVASTGRAPVTAQETLTYPSLLEDPNPPAETLKPPVEPAPDMPAPVAAGQSAGNTLPANPAKPPATTAAPPAGPAKPAAAVVAPQANAAKSPAAAAMRPVAVTPATTADGTLSEPPGNGFVVQVAAVRQRDRADIIARRLTSKGYPAFVTIAGSNFRVRIGKYNDRSEAESVAGRLEREEKFKPWITR